MNQYPRPLPLLSQSLLEEALTARVIEEMRATAGRYQFTHALIQEPLTEGLSLTRRVRLHAKIGETLESVYGDRAEDQAAELAYHFAQAETILGCHGAPGNLKPDWPLLRNSRGRKTKDLEETRSAG